MDTNEKNLNLFLFVLPVPFMWPDRYQKLNKSMSELDLRTWRGFQGIWILEDLYLSAVLALSYIRSTHEMLKWIKILYYLS